MRDPEFGLSSIQLIPDSLKVSLCVSVSATFLCCVTPLLGVEPSELEALGEMLGHAKKEERREAVYQLEKLGPEAAPLVPQLASALHDSDDQVWHGATMTLAAIGPGASVAIPDLVDQMGGGRARYREQRRHRSAFALSQIGEAAIPALRHALNDESAHRRWGALHAFGLMGEPAVVWWREMSGRLADEELIVRQEAQETGVALAEAAPEKLVPAVARLLENSDAEFRHGAAAILRRLGPVAAAQGVRGAVTHALIREDADTETAAELLRAAAALGVDPEFLSPLMIEALLRGTDASGESSSLSADAAFEAIATHDGLAGACVPALSALLQDRQAQRRQLAALLLGRLGSNGLPAASSLVVQLQQDLGASETELYLGSLILMGPGALPAILQAVETLTPDQLSRDHWTVRALEGLAPLAQAEMESRLAEANPAAASALLLSLPRYTRRTRPVEKEVLRFTRHEEAQVRAHAVAMLSRLPLPEKRWMSAIRQALTDTSPKVRVAAMQAMAQGPMPKSDRVDFLMEGLGAGEPEVRLAAVTELGRMGSAAERSVNALIDSAQGPSAPHQHRLAVVQALGGIGSGSARAVPFLMKWIDVEGDPDSEATQLLRESLRSLAAMGGEAKAALPRVNALIGDEDPEMRQAALIAFAKIETSSERLIPVYLDALEDPSPAVRQPVIEGLARLGEDGRSAAPALVDLLDSETDRQAALEALRSIRPDNLELCLRLLGHENAGARLLACDRLGRMGNKDAIPALRKALRDDYSFVRRRAREALERIERGGRRRR